MKLKLISAMFMVVMAFTLPAQTPQKKGNNTVECQKTCQTDVKKDQAACCNKNIECTKDKKADPQNCCTTNKETSQKSTDCCSGTKKINSTKNTAIIDKK